MYGQKWMPYILLAGMDAIHRIGRNGSQCGWLKVVKGTRCFGVNGEFFYIVQHLYRILLVETKDTFRKILCVCESLAVKEWL